MRNIHMMHMSPFRGAIHDANILCDGANAMFIHDGVSARIYFMMQMFPYRDGDAKCLVVQMPSIGYVMMQMLIVWMS